MAVIFSIHYINGDACYGQYAGSHRKMSLCTGRVKFGASRCKCVPGALYRDYMILKTLFDLINGSAPRQ